MALNFNDHAPNEQLTPINQAVAAATTVNADVDCWGYTHAHVTWRLAAAGAVGDLSLNEVRAYEPGDATLIDQEIPADATVAPALVSGAVYAQKTFTLRGLKKLQVRARNNNVAAKTIVVSVHLIRAA